ncbi:LysM repeat protein [Homoserinimonas aerilata]|uniref:LysM repeat protein n=1 Tax=Homoserinimonas aerilata TaxID=1162970 RepID=A0A542YJE8_9MICO|nr:LysM peptidoglycan-binding domain-containing protein [Homoserinimonas aerilata]TQL48161.1 LysM repeat protein [Homoserinimonas aerilata]
MSNTTERTPRHIAARGRSRVARGAFSTLPIVLAGSLAMTMNLTGPIHLDDAKKTEKDKATAPSQLRDSIRKALASATPTTAPTELPEGQIAVAAAPGSYTVVAGDTISSIAGHYGLSTASVLALNGLGWKSIIHPGQKLVLSSSVTPVAATPTTAAPSSGRYTIERGDTIGGIAARFGVSATSVLSANGLGWSSIIYPGQTLAIPGQSAPASLAPTAPPASTPAPGSSHTIASGDTLSSIAGEFGVSPAALAAANGMTLDSTIYAGASLSIPSAPAPVVASAGTVVPLSNEMAGHARTIISVGRSLGVSDYGLVIALAAAAQESTLRNLGWGDLDSVGLFQQRPTAGWGTVAQLTTPERSARLFFGGDQNPNKGVTRGLLEIPGWQSMTVTQAAQAVQISAYPDAYAKWETSARAWLAQLG